MSLPSLRASEHLHGVKYEIRGALARRAEQLEKIADLIVEYEEVRVLADFIENSERGIVR